MAHAFGFAALGTLPYQTDAARRNADFAEQADFAEKFSALSAISVFIRIPMRSIGVRVFGTMFSPVEFSARNLWTSELLRTL